MSGRRRICAPAAVPAEARFPFRGDVPATLVQPVRVSAGCRVGDMPAAVGPYRVYVAFGLNVRRIGKHGSGKRRLRCRAAAGILGRCSTMSLPTRCLNAKQTVARNGIGLLIAWHGNLRCLISKPSPLNAWHSKRMPNRLCISASWSSATGSTLGRPLSGMCSSKTGVSISWTVDRTIGLSQQAGFGSVPIRAVHLGRPALFFFSLSRLHRPMKRYQKSPSIGPFAGWPGFR